MVRFMAVAAVAGSFWLGAERAPVAAAHAVKTGTVKVHCGSGNKPGFVTPQKITINVGDDIEWTAAGNVDIESLEITLKDPTQVWPFAGERAKGVKSGTSGAARTAGTYGYDVRLTCRVRGTEAVEEVIDPDIIIL